VKKLLAAAGSLALVGMAAGCSSSSTVVDQASGGGLAHVGTTLTLKTLAGRQFQIAVKQVADPSQRTDGKSAPSGKRYIATLFQVTNSGSQTLSTDAGLDANLVGSNGTTYNPTHQTLSQCGGSTAKVSLGSGKSATTCVAFQVPSSVKVTQVQFYPAAGSASDYGQWLVP
jgi:hypothetical protein